MKSKTGWVDFKKIKEKVSMEDILGHYGLLKGLKRKENELVGFCPIHDGRRQKKGCFCANTAKNMWHCFSCGAGGNVLDFVSLMESVDIRQAGLLIQKWFGIVSGEDRKLAKEKEEVERPKRKKKKAEPEEAANPPLTFELKTLDSKHAYLKERGLKKETIKEFGLGYCKRGLMERRVVIPIHSEKGELIAYAGRYPGDPPEGELKYKLPPKFKKSLVVFNLNRVKDTGEDKGLILVKDFFDVFNLWQSGYKNVVALMGTSMSNEQERLIVQAVGGEGKVALMFDSDEAGRSGSEDALSRLVSQVYVKLIKLDEEGLQPDTLSKEKIKTLLG
ncbi:DNA primase [subsurface metagenome]